MNIRPLGFLIVLFCTSILIVEQHNNETRVYGIKPFTKKKKNKFQRYDEPLQFITFHKEIRTPDDLIGPSYPNGYQTRELLLAKQRAQATESNIRKKTSIEWTERGPGNVPGRTRALLDLTPAVENAILAGAATGGIWKSIDGGDSWSEKNDNLTNLPISSFAADKNLTRIYAGTGEFISSIFSAAGDGILVSTDVGETWNVLPATQGNKTFNIVTRLVVDPDNPNLVLCTTASSNLTTSPDRNSFIMRSSDGGQTWTKVLEVTNPLEQIIATPNNFSVMYATEKRVGVWKSVDEGKTWVLSNAGMYPSGRIELAVSPVNPSRVFASAEGSLSGAESDLYISDNAGETWGLVEMKFNGKIVDFLGNDPAAADSQGFYDNTILCDPFNADVVYVGGINLFQFTLGKESGTVDRYSLITEDASFLLLQAFSNIPDEGGRLTVGTHAEKRPVEIRFGPGLKQKAHRFLIPENKTSGVPSSDFTYQDYVDVPFEVWDLTQNQQLMISFRDQNRNGVFDLSPQFLTADGIDYLKNSREYLYINNEEYNPTGPSSSVGKNAGHEYRLMYSIFPALAENAEWNPENLPLSKIKIDIKSLPRFLSNTVTVADAYVNFDGKNAVNQRNLDLGVHPDHHFMVPVITDPTAKTYKIILGNDGGVFISNNSTTPGITDKSWSFKGMGYNTSQFYGADKKPGFDEYIGGLQDNGTRISPKGVSANASTAYNFALGGDGFEVLWNSRDEKKILATIYYGSIYRSTDAGTSWVTATAGLPVGTDFPFITKLASSKDYPDRIYTVSRYGVHYSSNFGSSWNHSLIPEKFVTTSVSLLDVEVSRANANVVWAGSGMSNVTGLERNLFVSTDAGKTFQETSNFQQTILGSITKLASHPSQPETAYALFSFSDRPKILRTEDLGKTWEDISGFGSSAQSSNGFPNVAVYCLYVRPDNPNIIWAGTEIGIVESTDNGKNWSILLDFPKVSVWDMKGQDDQVVIATHGRGIWTATVSKPQSNPMPVPSTIAHGISPRKELALRLNVPEAYDSLSVVIDQTVVRTDKRLAVGLHDRFIKGIAVGSREITLVAYVNGAPFQGPVYTVNHRNLADVKTSYSTYFTGISDFYVRGFSLQSFSDSDPLERKNIQTAHPYKVNETYSILLKHPIKVSSELPAVFYNEVAIVEPENDYVVLEASKNGLDWIDLTSRYDARQYSAWQDAYNSNQPGLASMLKQRRADLSPILDTGDTVLLQWRLHSGVANVGWGWSIDYISIQEPPVNTELPFAKESVTVFPNPAPHKTNLDYTLDLPATVEIKLLTVFGTSLYTLHRGRQDPGTYRQTIPLEDFSPGSYLVMISINGKKELRKLVIQK